MSAFFTRITGVRLAKVSGVFAAAALAASPVLALDNIKMMIGANPGGGFDQTGRGIGKAMMEAGAVKTVQYENKGGAGGTIGLAQFVNASKGDPNAMIVTGAVMVGAIVRNKPPITLANATPLARLFYEYNVFVVPANSPIKTMADVVAQLKNDPGSVKWGGGSRGSVDHISVAMIAKAVGVDPGKINYVPFQGGVKPPPPSSAVMSRSAPRAGTNSHNSSRVAACAQSQ